MKSIFYLFFSIFLFFSCKSQHSEELNLISFEKIKKISLNAEVGIKHFPFSYRLVNDSVYLTLNSDISKQLITYNLNTGEIKEKISINFFNYQNLKAINYHNKDSIFLAFNASAISRNHFHDSSVMVISNTGKISKIMDFRNSPVCCSYNHYSIIDSSVLLPAPFTEVNYSDNKLFFGLMKLNHTPGDSFSESIKLPIAGHYDLKNDKFTSYDEIKGIPFFKEGRFYHRLNQITQVILSNENIPILAFGHTPMIYKYNYKNLKKFNYRIKSKLVDTIKPNNDCKTGNCKDYYNAFYGKICYDRYRKLYYRFVTLPAKKDDSPYRKNIRKVSMIVADMNFNYIGEGIIPDNLFDFSLIITQEGLWFYNATNKDKLTYELFTLEYNKGTKEELIKKYNKKTEVDNKYGVLPYLKDLFKVNGENSAIVIIPSDLGCRSCASTISKFYVDNQNLFKDKKLYFIIAGIAKFTVNPFLKQNNIKKEMPNLFIDNKGEYLNYFESFNNPRLFILDNNKVVYDKVFSPSELIELELKIKEYSENN